MARFDLNASFFGGRGFTLYHAWGQNSSMPLSPHFHDEYLICAQLRGTERCSVSGKLREFSPGDAVFINPHQVHTGNADGVEELEYISLYVDQELVSRLANDLGAATKTPEFTVVTASQQQALVSKLQTLLELVRDAGPEPLYPTKQAPVEADVRLPQVASLAGSAAPEPPLHQAVDVESALLDVVSHAFEEFSNLRRPFLRSSSRIGHRKIARAVDHIRALEPSQNPAAISLDELAEVAGLSKYHFLRQFSQVVGMTPGAYLRTLRLCHAARKLRTTDMSILDIALSVGFADHPSFSRAFARHMGMTPSDYQALGPLEPR